MNTMLAAVSGNALLTAVLWVVVAGLVYWLLLWVLSVAAIPEPFNKVANVILAVAVAILLINALLILVGKPFIVF